MQNRTHFPNTCLSHYYSILSDIQRNILEKFLPGYHTKITAAANLKRFYTIHFYQSKSH